MKIEKPSEKSVLMLPLQLRDDRDYTLMTNLPDQDNLQDMHRLRPFLQNFHNSLNINSLIIVYWLLLVHALSRQSVMAYSCRKYEDV